MAVLLAIHAHAKQLSLFAAVKIKKDKKTQLTKFKIRCSRVRATVCPVMTAALNLRRSSCMPLLRMLQPALPADAKYW